MGFGQEVRVEGSDIYLDNKKISRNSLQEDLGLEQADHEAISKIVDLNHKKKTIKILFWTAIGYSAVFTGMYLYARDLSNSFLDVIIIVMSAIGLLFGIPSTLAGGVLWLVFRSLLNKRINAFNDRV